jgi:hypothetical protein
MALSSCKLFQPPKVYHYDYHLRNAEIDESSITRSEVVCDLNIDFTKRVSGASREHTGDDRAMRAKEEAYFNALVNNNIDVLPSEFCFLFNFFEGNNIEVKNTKRTQNYSYYK